MIKDQFSTLINNTELAYFDSAATTQTHDSVTRRMEKYYYKERCNIHRGDFPLSQKVSIDCEDARESVAKLINADPEHVIFTQGTTDGLNMVAEWHKDTEVVIISEAEHSANILPWLAQGRTVDNGRLIVLPIGDSGYVHFWEHEELFESHPGALLSIVGTSNVTGKTNDLQSIINMAKFYGLTVCVDAAQTISSHKLDMNLIDPDYLVFSAHKMFGPTGVGALYTKRPPDDYPCVKHGGGTVVGYDFSGRVEYQSGPMKHEAGTPDIASILGFGVAADWVMYTGYEEITNTLNRIHYWLTDAGLFNIPGVDLLYPSTHDVRNVYSFVCKDFHPSDISTYMGLDGVAVRVGKVCSHPIVNKHSPNGILRVSTHIYNTKEDCIKLVESLCKAIAKLSN